MDSIYKLLVCYNRTNYAAEQVVPFGSGNRVYSDSLVSFVHYMVRVLLDQSLWETSINLPPNHGVLGLLLAIIMGFCIPFALAAVCGLGFRALESSFFNAALLNATQRAHGLVIFSAPIHILGKSGIWIIFIVILLLIVTSCMFTIVGASSILHHDVLATYIRPFKKHADKAKCLLCGKRRGHLASRRNICRCRSMLECAACHTDTWFRRECKNRPTTTLVYGCKTHGAYRAYMDEMSKNVLQISFILMAGMIPLFIIFAESTLTNFLYYGLCTPFVGCLCLSILWARLSKVALLSGYFVSAGASLTLWLLLECTFFVGSEGAQLIGLTVAFLGGFLLPVLITFLHTKPLQAEAMLSVWSSVQEIDNPLVPWPEVFTREKKPALSEVRRALAPLRRLTWKLITFNLITFVGIWQVLGHTAQSLDFDSFFFYVCVICVTRGCASTNG
ncbi:unnamed protein product [Hydatigera taeniaeformis]|uniref:Urea transporter n=1 Tax=Hydatigena taeniaeformis TaxID=6205 RepID=A0A0R3WNQ1_HYDTA|nr:unnamed protein product [Hydatigera taeniaeformis]